MSRAHIEQLASIRDEFAAARAALEYVQQAWPELVAAPELHDVGLSHLRQAARNLEATYIIRLFSAFEALLRDHLAARYPGHRMPRDAEPLINRVARRARIPDPVREGAQRVRAYRNSIVHPRGEPAFVLSFREARRALNRFLAPLLDSP